MFFRSLASLTAILIIPVLVVGQIIGVKTLPLITTRQFNLTPSYYSRYGRRIHRPG